MLDQILLCDIYGELTFILTTSKGQTIQNVFLVSLNFQKEPNFLKRISSSKTRLNIFIITYYSKLVYVISLFLIDIFLDARAEIRCFGEI